ncbi:DUF805 domain-containing protein [Chitinophaga sp. 30R24]|uniref:DUF805 domain-containing protein n=1 Tax=Chitinophaga sp. 30R24 TaxID=3248838 RepID=UPI003B908984
MFKKPFSFSGRIKRTEYGLSLIAYIASCLLMEFLNETIAYVSLIIFLPMLWLFIAQSVKRAHDLNKSGWFIIIPFYGLWLLFAEGIQGSNKYGDDPKGFVDVVEIESIGVDVEEEKI